MIQFSGRRPRYSSVRGKMVHTFPACVEVSLDETSIRIKTDDEPLHLSVMGMFCIACGCSGKFVWTDDSLMWERRDDRCNYAYIP